MTVATSSGIQKRAGEDPAAKPSRSRRARSASIRAAYAATVGSRSRTHMMICPADIAPEVRATSLPP
jgi:hypothetical protein